MRLQDHLDSLRRATGLETLQKAFEGALTCFGFQHYQFVLLNDHPQLHAGDKGVVLCTYPAAWTRRYEREGFAHLDPMRQAAIEHHTPFTWDALRQNPSLNGSQQAVLDAIEEAGLVSGIGIPLHGPAGACATIGLASTQADIRLDARVLTQLHMLGLGLYNRFWSLQLRRSEGSDRAALSAREQDILLLLARGHTKADISRIRHISIHTVNHHVRNVLKKLNARNATSAVYHATSRGLIPMMGKNGDELKTT